MVSPLWLCNVGVSVSGMNWALKWLIPGGAILISGMILVVGFGGMGFLEAAGTGLPWIVCCGAALLAAFFHRSRVTALAVALLALGLLASSETWGFTSLYLFGGLVAVVTGVFALLRDHGVLSVRGLLQLTGVLVLGVAGGGIIALAPSWVATLLAAMPLPPRLTLWTGLPQPVFLSFILALGITVSSSVRRDEPVERGMVWFLLAVAVGLYFSFDPGSMLVLFLAAGLILAASVLETSYVMAFEDDLTGLPARRALHRDLEGLRGAYTVAIVDVDHFKSFNDKFGHDVGDQVLRMVAVRLAQTPGGARAYRIGGEEFALLFSGRDLAGSIRHLQEARRSVEDAVFILRSWRRPRKKPVDPGAWRGGGRPPKRLSVTVSIGAADSSGKDVAPGIVLKRADQALFRAKDAGRNRVAR